MSLNLELSLQTHVDGRQLCDDSGLLFLVLELFDKQGEATVGIQQQQQQ